MNWARSALMRCAEQEAARLELVKLNLSNEFADRPTQRCLGQDLRVAVVRFPRRGLLRGLLPRLEPRLKGSVGEGPNQTNYSEQSSVRILAKDNAFC